MAALPDWELWACADTVMRQHGAEAPRFVAERIDALVLEGDAEGVRTWRAIAERVDRLRKLPEGEAVLH